MKKRIRKLFQGLSRIKYHLPFAFFFFIITKAALPPIGPSCFFLFIYLIWLIIFSLSWGLESSFLFGGAMVFLGLCPFLIAIKSIGLAEDLAIGSFLFLAAGFIQRLAEREFEFLIKVDFDEFCRNLENEIRTIRQTNLFGRPHFWLQGDKATYDGIFQSAKKWFLVLLAELNALILIAAIREVFFYKYFFGENYTKQLASFLLPQIKQIMLVMLVACLAIVVIKRRIWLKKTLFVSLFLFVFLMEKNIFVRAREKFELQPYILKIVPDIATNWMEVKIIGHNFGNPPFLGKVLLGEKEQKIVVWSDKTIVIEIDPIRSQSGNLVVTKQHPDKGLLKSNAVFFTHYNSQKATPEEEKRFWEMLKLLSK